MQYQNKTKLEVMKKIILSASLLITSFAFAENNTKEIDKDPTKISEKKRLEIVNRVNQPIFFWEVKSAYGVASGYTNSEESAKRTIKLMSQNDVVSSKIIEKYN